MRTIGRRGGRGASASLMLMAAMPALLSAQSMRTVTMSRQIEDEQEVRVFVEYGIGTFSIRPLADGLLYRMNLRYDEDRYEPVAEYASHRLNLGLESRRGVSSRGRSDQGGLELELTRDIPIDLDLEFGAVHADIDLGGLMLTDLDLSTGASESVVDVSEPNRSSLAVADFEIGAAEFTARHLGNLNAERIQVDAGVGKIVLQLDGEWVRDAEVAIDMGLGALELHVPEGLGFRLRRESFLTAIDPEGLVKRGNVYESLDWAEAERKVTVDLDAAFGSVKVVWIPASGSF